MPKKLDNAAQNTLVLNSKVVLARPRLVTQRLEFSQSVVVVTVVPSKSILKLTHSVVVQRIGKGEMYYTFNCTLHRGRVHETVEIPLKVLKQLLDSL